MKTFRDEMEKARGGLVDAEKVYLGLRKLVPELGPDDSSEATKEAKHRKPAEVATQPTLPTTGRSSIRVQRLLSKANMMISASQYEEAINACDEALGVEGASASEISELCNSRALANAWLGRLEEAGRGWSRVIDALPGAPVELVANALFNRGVVHGLQGSPDQAIADYTRVIDALPGAPVELVANALLNRGVVHGQKGSADQAMADYTRVIDALPGASVEQVAKATGGRGWLHYEAGRIDEFLSDSENALARAPDLGVAAFNIGLGLLAKGRDAEALERYRKAVLEFPKDIAAARKDVEEAVGKWLTPERAKPVLEILKGDAP